VVEDIEDIDVVEEVLILANNRVNNRVNREEDFFMVWD
jgi:hypothetical protein